MQPLTRLILLGTGSGFLFCLDQTLKYVARTNPHKDLMLFPGFGWEFYANPGIAFGIPFPQAVLLVLTPIVLLGLLTLLLAYGRKEPIHGAALLLIFFGALSNLIDRFLFEVTVDYFRIFTSIINLADLMIVTGIFLLLFTEKQKGVSHTT